MMYFLGNRTLDYVYSLTLACLASCPLNYIISGSCIGKILQRLLICKICIGEKLKLRDDNELLK